MNPIIAAIKEHIDNGDQPTNFFTDQPLHERRSGLLVRLMDGRHIPHAIKSADHNEFFCWFKEAEQWWDTITDAHKRS